MEEKRSDVAIYVMGHNTSDMKNNRLFTPLQIGASYSSEDLCELKDNTGENISNLNLRYAELTGIYWIWNNGIGKDVKYVGQCTYNRQFEISEDFNFDFLFSNYDIMITNKFYFDTTLREQYSQYHNVKDLDRINNIILRLYPAYAESVSRVNNGNFVYNANGFIMKVENYHSYCKFLFSILLEFDKELGFKTHDDAFNYIAKEFENGSYSFFDNLQDCINYQRRIEGFLSERILTIFVDHNFKYPYFVNYNNTKISY